MNQEWSKGEGPDWARAEGVYTKNASGWTVAWRALVLACLIVIASNQCEDMADCGPGAAENNRGECIIG